MYELLVLFIFVTGDCFFVSVIEIGSLYFFTIFKDLLNKLATPPGVFFVLAFCFDLLERLIS